MNIIKAIILGALRHFLTPWLLLALTYVLKQGWVTPDQQNQVTLWFDGWLDFIVISMVAALPAIGFSVWNKLKARFKLDVALQLPSGSTNADVKEVTKDASMATIASASAAKAISFTDSKPETD